jgi:hypothetical protein
LGCPVWLADDFESPTDDPRNALKTREPQWFVDNFDFEAELLPPDQQNEMLGARRLFPRTEEGDEAVLAMYEMAKELRDETD